MVPEESGKDPRHAAGLSALVRGMERRNVVAIVRVNLKKGPKLHLGVLAPRLGSASRPDTAILNALPFAEDFRHYSFPSLLPADLPPAKRPDKSQFDAALRLVAAMDLGGGGNGGGAGSSGGVTKELLKPEATPNPALQRFLYVIGQRALHPGAPVAEADPLVEAVLEPPLARLPPEAAEALKAAAAKLRTEAVQAPAGAAGAAAAAAGPIGAPPAAEGAARPSAAAAGGVGTADPVQDFRQMVSAGRVDEAVPQLADVVPRILDSSPGDALHGKAMACVQTLRDVCLKHGKATAFNALLRSLAVRYAGDPLHGSFLQRLAEDGVTLISRSDSAQSDATALEAEEWLQQQLAGDDGAAAAMATSAPLAAAAAQPPPQQQQQGLQAAADAEMEDEFADME